MTIERETKVREMRERRFSDLHLVAENVDDPHNLGAILRTCDAVGVGRVHLVYTNGKLPRMRELKSDAASSAAKWLDIVNWDSVEGCVQALRADGLRILVAALREDGRPQWSFDLARPAAIVVGNEHDGVSAELISIADGIITIPMRGMVQSLNVSVAAAVMLEEGLRQRLENSS